MLEFLASEFYDLSRWLAKVCANQTLLLTTKGQQEFQEVVPKLYKYCDELGLTLSRNKIAELARRVNEGCQTIEIPRLLRELDERIHEELQAEWFFHVAREKVPYLRVMGALYSEILESNFRFAYNELEHAGSCYAFKENTACVFHSMRALDRGLRALADKLEFLPADYESENWKNIIDIIEKRIRKMEEEPKGAEKSAKLRFYSALVLEFRYFKDAWRNHVSHGSDPYDEQQAHRVLVHVFDFMCEAAKGGLAEKETA